MTCPCEFEIPLPPFVGNGMEMTLTIDFIITEYELQTI